MSSSNADTSSFNFFNALGMAVGVGREGRGCGAKPRRAATILKVWSSTTFLRQYSLRCARTSHLVRE